MTTKDAWISEFRKDRNYGDGGGYLLNEEPGPPMMFLGFSGRDKKVVLLGFDVSKIGTSKVSRAILRVCCPYSGAHKSCDVDAKPILKPWEELIVTWENQPNLGRSVSTTTLEGTHKTDVWYEWDVTPIVNDMLTGKAYGVALDPQGDYGVDRDIACRESGDGKEARLVITV